MKKIFAVVIISSIILTGCSGDSKPVASQAGNTNTVEIKPLPGKAMPSPKPAYDFQRQLNNCVLAVCQPLPSSKMKTSDYNSALIAGMNLSTNDTLASAREKLNIFYKGMVSSGLGSTTNPKLKIIYGQLSPGTNKNLHEYDVFIRTDGMSNGSKVYDWGARVRCAPVSGGTPWQTTPCD